jgi:hypothetical protein
MLNGSTYTVQNEKCELHLESLDGSFSTTIMANSTEQINDMIPLPDYNGLKKQYPYMDKINFPKLAERPIEILVGFNYPGIHVALAADISGKNIREPSCRKTVFGNTAIYRAMEPPSTIMLTQVMKEARLERLCEQLLEFDEAGLAHVYSQPNSLMSPEDKRALQIVEEGISRKETGHIQVPIPWANDNPELPHNHDEVKRSDAKQEAKLKEKNPDAYCQLCGTIGEWLELDVARPLPPEVDPQDGFYIPKVLVIKNERDSTQCRICMDCSSSYGHPRKSLNDEVLIGPKLQGDILEILIRFRMELITICADVTKMFLNIKLHPDDKKYHRFFLMERHINLSHTHLETNRHHLQL